ncbi:serine hydrolase [Paenibacillus spongiae]|uniref:Serine hydrolase n=1 Tax=Paenibacillus spongiae TaxID=2909671 RepID=A0ABY5SA10_9BACL|nr:serine hydrolase [Paenibacillus spongiae]UVI30767.1 serine hydrolase [Paenibacillus spongiae]
MKTRSRRPARICTAAVLALSLTLPASVFAADSPAASLPYSVAAISPFQSAPAANAAGNTDAVPVTLPALTSGPQDPKEVEAFLDGLFAKDEIKRKASAATVSIVRDGKVLATKGYGVTDTESNTPVDPDKTAFRIASVSKVFTAAAVLQLVDQGKISLQDNIEKYLDGHKVTNPFDKPVTIEMLLTHTTGFEVRDPSSDNFLFDPAQTPMSLKDAIFADFPPVVREPGTSYMYDNFASELQGYIVQQVSGEKFSEYVENHIFKPLGMNASSFSMPDKLAERLATAYDPAGNAIPVYRLSPSDLPEGSMISTSGDMARFMNAFLTGGKTEDGKVILSPDALKGMSTYHSSIHNQVPDTTYGFEAPFVPGKTNGQHIIAKGGDILGFSSLMWLLPDQKTGVFISYNTNQDLRDDLYKAFMDHYYSGKKDSFGKEGYKPQAAAELAKFEGIYADLRSATILSNLTVSADGILTMENGLTGQHKLTQVDDLLFIDDKGAPLAFRADTQGNILYLKYGNPVSYAAKKPAAAGFPDIPSDHPYAKPIHNLQSLGLLTDDASKPFEPLQAVTRGEFIHALAVELGLPASENPAKLSDIADSKYKAHIQGALELGIITGTNKGTFEPDRSISREEAAVIIARILHLSGYPESESKVKLAPGTVQWAEPAVKMVVEMKLHGPEVTVKDGVTEFNSKAAMNKQELAALMYALLLPF